MKQSRTRSFAANIIIIFTAQIAVKLLGMLYRMVITNIDGFGDAGNGFYSAGFQIYTLLLAVSSIGIPNAVSKLISEKAAAADYAGTQKIFKTSLLIFAAIGALLSIGLFAFSVPIAKYIINMDGAEYTMAALAPSIFFVCVLSVFRGYFSGVNRMNVMSASQVIEQIFKSVLTVLFVLAAQGLPPEIMSGWANLATTAATVLSTLYLLFMYKADGRREAGAEKAEVRRGFFSAAKEILMIAVPISLCSVISAVNRIIDTATITRGIERAFGAYIPAHGAAGAVYAPTAAQLSDEAVRLAGMLSKSDTLLNLPLALNIAFATVLVPYISKCRVVGDSFLVTDKNNDVAFRFVKKEEFMLSSVFAEKFSEIQDEFDETHFYLQNFQNKKVYIISFMRENTDGNKVYVISDPASVPYGWLSLKISTCIVMLLFMIYWVLTAMWVYQNAVRSRLYAPVWGIITLFTNLAGVLLYVIYKNINSVCAFCGAVQSSSNLFCVHCGKQIGISCVQCGSTLKMNDDYCPKCGHKVKSEKDI